MAKLICKTQRLSIFEFELEDFEFILELVNDPDWIQNIGDRGIRNKSDAESYLQKLCLSYADNGFGLYKVVELSSNTAVGMCGLVKRAELDDVDLGFAMLPRARGQKYAQESSFAILKYARELGLTRLLGIVAPQNQVSAKVLEKVGMSFEKKAKVRPNDIELLIYSIELK